MKKIKVLMIALILIAALVIARGAMRKTVVLNAEGIYSDFYSAEFVYDASRLKVVPSNHKTIFSLQLRGDSDSVIDISCSHATPQELYEATINKYIYEGSGWLLTEMRESTFLGMPVYYYELKDEEYETFRSDYFIIDAGNGVCLHNETASGYRYTDNETLEKLMSYAFLEIRSENKIPSAQEEATVPVETVEEVDEQDQIKTSVDYGYQPPESLGDTMDKLFFELEGVLYTVPIPVSVMTDNGWTIVDETNPKEEVQIEPLESYGITLENANGGVIEDVSVRNPTNSVITVQEALITEMKIKNSGNVDLQFLGGIGFDSTHEEIIISTEDQVADNGDVLSYFWDGRGDGAWLSADVGKDDGEVKQFFFVSSPQCYKWKMPSFKK